MKITNVRLDEALLERQHEEGYAQHPVREGEFDGWEPEQVWMHT